jgi:hypothetical protein
MRARYYDAVVGAFESEDPGRDGVNWFSYASGSPTNSVDSNGKSAQRDVLKVIAAVFVAITGTAWSTTAFGTIDKIFSAFVKVFQFLSRAGRYAALGLESSIFSQMGAYLAYTAVVVAAAGIAGATIGAIMAVWTVGWCIALYAAMTGVDMLPAGIID